MADYFKKPGSGSGNIGSEQQFISSGDKLPSDNKIGSDEKMGSHDDVEKPKET